MKSPADNGQTAVLETGRINEVRAVQWAAWSRDSSITQRWADAWQPAAEAGGRGVGQGWAGVLPVGTTLPHPTPPTMHTPPDTRIHSPHLATHTAALS